MRNITSPPSKEPTDSSFRWMISHATSSHSDCGPDLIAVRLDAHTVKLIREFLDNLQHMVVRGSAMVRMQWLGAHVEFLSENENELETSRLLAELNEATALVLPEHSDLPASCLGDRDIRAECDSFTMLRVNDRFAPQVFASARIKHTGIEVESKHDLWPLIDATFPITRGAVSAA